MSDKIIMNDGESATKFDAENIQTDKEKEGMVYPRKISAKGTGA